MTMTLSPKAALLLSTITMSAIDGDLDRNEMAIINRLDGFALSKEWDLAIATWEDNSMNECINIVAASLNEKQQRVAMANLVDIALADGHFEEDENFLLRAYAEAFKVPDSEIEKIVDVISIKNDKTLF